MKKLFTFLLFALFLSPLENCNCDQLNKANLFIKKVQQLYDYFGNPVYDFYTGQPVTYPLPNAMFYNERTQEYFNPDFGSIWPNKTGDYIDFATAVTNAYSDLNNCRQLAPAAASVTSMPVNFTFPNGTTTTYSLNGSTPVIGVMPPSAVTQGDNCQYGVGRFQLGGAGSITVNTVTADANNNVSELNENDNSTIIGIQTRIDTRQSPILIEIVANGPSEKENYEGIVQVPLNKDPSELEMFKNMNGKHFNEFLKRNLSKSK